MNKQYRVKKSKDIEEILKNHKFSGNPYFTVYMKEQNETIHFRYAMSVSKKIGNAVVRNQLKRQIRAIMRECSIIPNVDIFIIARSKLLTISFQTMKKELLYLLNKQNLLIKGENNGTFYK